MRMLIAAVFVVLAPTRIMADAAKPNTDAGLGSEASVAQDKKQPTQLTDSWTSVEKLPKSQKIVWASDPGSGFSLSVHHKLASEASVRCSDSLVHAQYRQDILKQFDATAHFDNCAFKESCSLIESELAEVKKVVDRKGAGENEANEAMSHLGKVMHLVQDFYAHSNWVELQHLAGLPFDNALVVPVWTPEGRQRLLSTKYLVSGYVWWDAPKDCTKEQKVPSHGDMCKDGPETPRGKTILEHWNSTAYDAAYGLAKMATGEFLAWAYKEWPLLQKQCGNELYVVVAPDKRPE